MRIAGPTTRIRAADPGGARARADRVFYTSFAIVVAVVIFAGFTPTFFARGSFVPLPPLTPFQLVHGVVFTAWVLLFVAQPMLIAADERVWHRRLGVVGGCIAATMFATGLAVTIAFERSHAPEPWPTLLVHLFTNVAPLCIFAACVAMGIARRHTSADHKRWMMLATVILVPPATGRLLPHFGLEALNTPLYAAFAFANAVYDRATLGRVHRISLYGAAGLIGLDLLVTWLLALV